MRRLRRDWLSILLIAIGAAAAAAVLAAHQRLSRDPLPYPEPDRIVTVPGAWITYAGGRITLDQGLQHGAEFETVGLYQEGFVALVAGGLPRRLRATSVDPGFFQVLRAQASWGRVVTVADEARAHAVVSAELGRRLQSQSVSADLVVRLDEVPFTVVGIMPPRFDFPGGTDVWIPFGAGTQARQGRGNARVLARLAPDVTLSDALTKVASLLPGAAMFEGIDRLPLVKALRDELNQGALPVLRTLMLLCVLLMAATCVDVAGLGVVAAGNRSEDLAVRLVLGATRTQLLRQAIRTSSATLLVSGVVGSLGAFGLWHLFTDAGRVLAPSLDWATVDWRLPAYALAAAALGTAALAAGEVFAIMRLDTRRKPLLASVKLRGASQVRRLVIGAQITVAFILLGATISAAEALIRASRVSAGFSATEAVSLSLSVPRARYDTSRLIGQLAQRLEADVRRSIGGVVVGLTDTDVGQDGVAVRLAPWLGSDGPLGGRGSIAVRVAATTDYFSAVGIGVVAGRPPLEPEVEIAARTVVVSEAASKLLAETPAAVVGRDIEYDGERYTVAGVMSDVRLFGPHNPAPAVVYFPLGYARLPFVLTVVASAPEDGFARLHRSVL